MKATDFAAPLVVLALLSFGCYILFPVAIISFSDPHAGEDFCPDQHPPECVSTPDYCLGRSGSYMCTQVKQLFSGITALCLFLAAILAAYNLMSKGKVNPVQRAPHKDVAAMRMNK
jgi:hypothetical protein